MLDGACGPGDVAPRLGTVEIVQRRAQLQVDLRHGSQIDLGVLPCLEAVVLVQLLPREGKLHAPAPLGLAGGAHDAVAVSLGEPTVLLGLLPHDADGGSVLHAGEGIEQVLRAHKAVGIGLEQMIQPTAQVQRQLDGVAVIGILFSVGKIPVHDVKGQIQVGRIGGGEGRDPPTARYVLGASHPRDHMVGVDDGGGQTGPIPVRKIPVPQVDLLGKARSPGHGDGTGLGEGGGISAQIRTGLPLHLIRQTFGSGDGCAEGKKQGKDHTGGKAILHDTHNDSSFRYTTDFALLPNGAPLCFHCSTAGPACQPSPSIVFISSILFVQFDPPRAQKSPACKGQAGHGMQLSVRLNGN